LSTDPHEQTFGGEATLIAAQYSFTIESDNELYFAMTIDDYDR